MHYHGYLWAGPKQHFDEDALRRPPHPLPPPAPAGDDDTVGKRLAERYRVVRSEFPVMDLPPLETAYWLIKPGTLVRGTWDEPKEAAEWLGERLTEFAFRFASEADRDSTRLAILVNAAAERLGRGRDVSHGFYLERPSFLSLALVCCTPNPTATELSCPGRQP
ncbi:hypothetical protein [Streptomyces sp. NRRL F-5755]|uniref:hypothetical protein n=1 Tax=Streptomyces sp. NRRL F-5755 TaxID=1519475 RepID=UPI0006ADE8F6|nr:hypothetical protein [Streptomyces sp. NRRL F-5755]